MNRAETKPGRARFSMTQLGVLGQQLREQQQFELEQEALAMLEADWAHAVSSQSGAERLETIRRSFTRAEGYGFEGARQLLTYLNASMALGSDFDRDPEYPWVAEILESVLPFDIRARRLDEAVIVELQRRAGAG